MLRDHILNAFEIEEKNDKKNNPSFQTDPIV